MSAGVDLGEAVTAMIAEGLRWNDEFDHGTDQRAAELQGRGYRVVSSGSEPEVPRRWDYVDFYTGEVLVAGVEPVTSQDCWQTSWVSVDDIRDAVCMELDNPTSPTLPARFAEAIAMWVDRDVERARGFYQSITATLP